jgi:hypothetical protein
VVIILAMTIIPVWFSAWRYEREEEHFALISPPSSKPLKLIYQKIS